MNERHGWKLFFHDCLLEQLKKLEVAVDRSKRNDPSGYESNANVKLYIAISHLIFESIPSDPSRPEYRLGKTMGASFRHWCRAKIGRRFRLFFRYDSKLRIIIFAWVNDENTLRSAGSSSDPYAVFHKMLMRGHPPDDWNSLLAVSRPGML